VAAGAAAQTAPLGAFVPGGQRVAAARPTVAPLWYRKDGKLGVLRVQAGISDGTNTEISGEGLEEGMEIIIGLTVPEAAGAATTNPFQQQNQQRGGGFGGGGGGGGGGRGF
jgi:HlyD family secretion protein